MNGIVVARGGVPSLVTLSDRLRPPGIGFGVGWIHVLPASIHSDQLALAERTAERAVAALGLRDGIAFPQLIASPDGSVAVVEVAARIPGGQMADLVRHAVGVDLVEVALRFALGEPVPDEVALPRYSQPLAIRFLTASPGPLPTGTVTRIGPSTRCSTRRVVQAETYLTEGETIRPVRLDGDRRGYVIATADTSFEAPPPGRARLVAARRGGRVNDPRTALVGAGYDTMVDTWESWKDRITNDPRAEWCDELLQRLPRRAWWSWGAAAGRSRPGARRALRGDRRRPLP